MSPHVVELLDKIENPELREKVAAILGAVDAMQRENAHLRLKMQAEGCPYGHQGEGGGCELGYPGCACMDDLMAMMAWSPEDEDKAAVRLGRRLHATELALGVAQRGLINAARVLDGHGAGPGVSEAFRLMATAQVEVEGGAAP